MLCERAIAFRKDKCSTVRFVDEDDLKRAMKKCKHEIEKRRKRTAKLKQRYGNEVCIKTKDR